jgi:hypothetical protein
MKRFAATLGLLTALTAAGFAQGRPTRPTVHDNVRHGDRVVRLTLDISQSGTSHMWVRVRDPDGVYPYCATVQFERKTAAGWHRVGKGSAYDRDCFDVPEDAEGQSENKSFWDNFAYPDGRLKEDFLAGKRVRVHGFTTLGGDVKFAF